MATFWPLYFPVKTSECPPPPCGRESRSQPEICTEFGRILCDPQIRARYRTHAGRFTPSSLSVFKIYFP